MGKTSSKSNVVHNADPQIRIEYKQELHSEYHEDHAVKINILLVLVGLNLVIVIYQIWHKRVQRKVAKKVQSIANLDKV